MTTADTLSQLKRVNPWNAAFLLFWLTLFSVLAVRGTDPDRWSDWSFGDAQTMLSTRHWTEEGWVKNYLLFVPQGYAHVVKHLDEPELRQHAHGDSPYGGRGVGPRLYYTHYPSGYLVPYAAAAWLGFDSMGAARVVSVLMSMAGLGCFYLFLARAIRPSVAFATCVVYGLTPAFLGYADSLANMPIDDLLRYGFMLAVFYSTRATTKAGRWRANVVAWVLEFGMSLSSFDSVFFMFVWLIGWDFVEGRGFRFVRYFIFGMAAVCGHGVQLLQNVWYLGTADALLDVRAMFLLKSGGEQMRGSGETGVSRVQMIAGMLLDRAQVISTTTEKVMVCVVTETKLFWTLVGIYAFHRVLFRRAEKNLLPGVKILTVLFLAGLAYIFVLPNAAGMDYQGHQMLPFYALAIGGLLVAAGDCFAQTVRLKFYSYPGVVRRSFQLAWLLVAVVGLYDFGQYFWYARRGPWSSADHLSPDVPLARVLSNYATAHPPVYFNLGGMTSYWNKAYLPGYPQIHPMLEYYAGSRPILCFDQDVSLVTDLKQLLQMGGPNSFSPVIIAGDQRMMTGVLERLRAAGVIGTTSLTAQPIYGKLVLDLTPYLVPPNPSPSGKGQ
ncbi:MAG: hypothetical protein K8T25_05880 [Planctomycetia bacterium]|nr:hypothetical protein [Planctomycetia bacterium]